MLLSISNLATAAPTATHAIANMLLLSLLLAGAAAAIAIDAGLMGSCAGIALSCCGGIVRPNMGACLVVGIDRGKLSMMCSGKTAVVNRRRWETARLDFMAFEKHRLDMVIEGCNENETVIDESGTVNCEKAVLL